ncbi:hypothetical protein PM082_008906 [Marasmius tenuissimus]|nr:hypothetical protein PM082_008906 [Marasmius tenuissimus]
MLTAVAFVLLSVIVIASLKSHQQYDDCTFREPLPKIVIQVHQSVTVEVEEASPDEPFFRTDVVSSNSNMEYHHIVRSSSVAPKRPEPSKRWLTSGWSLSSTADLSYVPITKFRSFGFPGTPSLLSPISE